MMSGDGVFLIDVRDVVQRMRDKSYHSIGEAFEDIFFDGCYRDIEGAVRPEFIGLCVDDEGEDHGG
jgi:hypothetical protein